MAQSTRVDSGEVTDLIEFLAQAPAVVLADARAIVQKGALNIKTDAKRRIKGLRHVWNYGRTINYDTRESATKVWAEIGPDKTKQVGAGPHRTPGNLGNILEYGSPKQNTAPHPHMAPAAEAELPTFERYLQQAAAKAAGER